MKIPENKISHSSTFDTFTSNRVNIFFIKLRQRYNQQRKLIEVFKFDRKHPDIKKMFSNSLKDLL